MTFLSKAKKKIKLLASHKAIFSTQFKTHRKRIDQNVWIEEYKKRKFYNKRLIGIKWIKRIDGQTNI